MNVILSNKEDLLKLESLGVIEIAAKLICNFHVTDFIIGQLNKQEHKGITPLIKSKCLEVKNFDGEEVGELLMQCFDHGEQLSIEELSSLYLTRQKIEVLLISSDKTFTKIAKTKDILVGDIKSLIQDLIQNDNSKTISKKLEWASSEVGN